MPELKKPISQMKKAERSITLERRRELKKAYIQREVQNPKLTKEDMLTPQVRKVMENLPDSLKEVMISHEYYKLYLQSEITEYLPNGVPYAVVDGLFDKTGLRGTVVLGNNSRAIKLNRPLILVDSRLPLRVRLNLAMHEFVEYTNFRYWDDPKSDDRHEKFFVSHGRAVKRENPSMRDYWTKSRYISESKLAIRLRLQSIFDKLKTLKLGEERIFKVHGISLRFENAGKFGYLVTILPPGDEVILLGYLSKEGILSLM